MLRAFMEEMEGTAAVTAADPPRTFESFFSDERKRLLRALFLLTGNAEEAEEIVQDAFLALWERWDRVATMDDPTGYLYRTAMNRHRSLGRRATRAARRAIGQAHGGDLFARADERDAVARALATLTPRRRQAVILTEMLGYSSVETSRLMRISDATVRRLAQDARTALRAELSEDDDG